MRSTAWLGRWQSGAAILSAAVLYALACPPYEWSWTAWIVPGLLLVPTWRLPPLARFASGLLFGVAMGYGVAAWLPHATLEYFRFNWLFAAGFAVAVYAIYAGIPYGLLTFLYGAAAARVPASARAPLAAWLWVGAELVRTHLFTGLPWELLGHTQSPHLWLVQIADLGGVYAVSFVMVLTSVAAAELLQESTQQHTLRAGSLRRMILPAATLLCMVAYGLHSRALHDRVTDERVRTVAVVQGNIANAFRWQRAFVERTLATYLDLTRTLRSVHPDLVVWPENAVSFYIDREARLRGRLGEAAGIADEGLLVGAPRLGSDERAHNSVYLIGPDATIRGTYDKRRLVPFAESDPFGFGNGDARSGYTDWVPGATADPLRAASFSLGTVICYEVLFPHLVRELVRNGAELLVNVSNDSWLDRGDGVAPRQQFSMAVFRAIETRRALVRAASSGVSGFITPFGAVQALVPAGEAGTAVAPVTLRSGLTPYVRWGDAWAVVGSVLAAAQVLRRRRSAPLSA